MTYATLGILVKNDKSLFEETALTGNETTIVGPTCFFTEDFSGTLGAWSNNADWNITSGELKHALSGVSGNSYNYADIGPQDLTTGSYKYIITAVYFISIPLVEGMINTLIDTLLADSDFSFAISINWKFALMGYLVIIIVYLISMA